MLIPIEISEDYTYYFNLMNINGIPLWHITDSDQEELPGWYLYFEKGTSGIRKRYETKEEALAEIDRINKISGKILKIWEEN